MRVTRQPPSSTPVRTISQRDSLLGALPAAIGSDDFYSHVAVIDPGHAEKWRRMVSVQASFKDAETDPSYDGAMRTYSASNRETLHRLTIALLRSPPSDLSVYDAFIELHPALFEENGACELDVFQQSMILANTEPSMLSFTHQGKLMRGVLHASRWRDLVHDAADETRAARTARGEAPARPR